MTTERKKWIILGCLVVLWIALILTQRSRMGSTGPNHVSSVPRRGTAARRPGSATAVQKQGKQRVELPRLQLNKLERVRPPFAPEARNIFASIEPSSALPLTPPSKPPVATTPPLPPPPDPFVEESKKVRFLGYAEADGKPMAFVSYESDVLVVPETGVFGRLLQVKKVDEDVLILSSTDGTKQVQITLGQESNALPNVGLGPRPGMTPPISRIERRNQP